ncbi:murein DD-endopeptidase MepM/ murein hydrolase activator NlpD [Caballeronia udeis]|uniref:Murein DD-endopeptidase MepM/ murein hydrolase activator NlpD n=1 Tax=Caballeronia udeis TaxID=1232866 RepID=A0ABW8MUU5_9BURK
MTKQTDIAKRAADELAAAMRAFQHAHVLFKLLEEWAVTGKDLDRGFLLAQIGAEITSKYGKRADGESDFFLAEVNHG